MFYVFNYLTVIGANPAAVIESIENDELIKNGERSGENSFSFDTACFVHTFVADLSSTFPDHELRIWSIPSNCSEGMGVTTVFFNGEFVEEFTDMELMDDMTYEPGFTPGDDEVDCSENVIE